MFPVQFVFVIDSTTNNLEAKRLFGGVVCKKLIY